ncbi:MAG: hypothetical protein AAGG44_15205 [Planctomycetota bacterium]
MITCCDVGYWTSLYTRNQFLIQGNLDGKVTLRTELLTNAEGGEADTRPPQASWTCYGNGSLSSLRLSAEGLVKGRERIGLGLGDLKLEVEKNRLARSARFDIANSDGSLVGGVELQLSTNTLPLLLDDMVALLRDYEVHCETMEYPFEFDSTRSDAVTPVSLTSRLSLHGSPSDPLSWGKVIVDRLAFTHGHSKTVMNGELQLTANEVRILRFQLNDGDGRAAGSGALARKLSGEHRLNLNVSDLELDRDLSMFGVPRLFGGSVALDMRLKKPARLTGLLDGWSGGIAVDADSIRYRGRSIGSADLQGTMDDGELDLTGIGAILGGESSVHLTRTLSKSPKGNSRRSEPRKFVNTLRCDTLGLQLKQVAAVMTDRITAARIDGTADLELQIMLGADQQLNGEATAKLSRLTLDERVLLDQARFGLSYQQGQLYLRGANASLLGGTAKATGAWNLQTPSKGNSASMPPRGRLRYQIQRIDPSKLIELLIPDQNVFDGKVSLSGEASFGRQVTISSTMHTGKGSLFGVPVQELDGNVRTYLNRHFQLERLESTNIHGRLAQGRTAGSMRIRNNSGRLGLEADVSVASGSMRQLGESVGFDHLVGNVHFGATASLRSSDLASRRKLKGVFSCDFSGAQAGGVPLLTELNRLVPAAELLNTSIRSGTIAGRLAGDQVRLEEIFLNSDAFWIVGQGRAELDSGYFDIDLLLQTGGGLEDQLVQNGLELAALAIVPEAVLLVEIADMLRNRSLVFRVKGNAAHPAIQFKLAESIAKSFVQQVRRQLLQKIQPLAVTEGVD